MIDLPLFKAKSCGDQVFCIDFVVVVALRFPQHDWLEEPIYFQIINTTSNIQR